MSRPRRPWSMARVGAGISRRVRGPYAGLDRIGQRLDALGGQVESLGGQVGSLAGQVESLAAQAESTAGQAATLDQVQQRLDALGTQARTLEAQIGELSGSRLREDLRDSLRALAANETRNRRLLEAVREEAGYQRAWDDDRPLVSVTVATIGRPELISRSLPSILAQSHEHMEVIVGADGASSETESAVAALGDPRIRYLDLGPRQTWTDDPVKLWMAAATRARNASAAAAGGSWIVEFDDDDAMRPECLEALLDLARGSRAEAVYGQVRQHTGPEPRDLCAFPPRHGGFSWAAGMYHAGLRFFGRELLAADLGLPGDWWLAERMLRAGVRFAMRDEVLCDAFASDRATDAYGRGRIPWSGDPGRS